MSSEVSTQLEQDATKRMFERLVAAKDKLKDANETIIKDLEGARMFQNAFCCADPIYKEQLAIILANKPDSITADTVASYLYGCFQPELAVEIACTPECANGLKNPDLAACDIASYQKKGKLTKLNSIISEEANVFLASGESLTIEDMKILSGQEVKVVTTYNRNNNTINYVLGQSFNVSSDLPQSIQSTQSTQSTSSTTNTSWIWVWAIIFIILVIILAMIVTR